MVRAPREWNHGVVIEAVRFIVDGEVFDVVKDGGTIHHTWVSGPNPDYGFSVGGSGAEALTDEQVRAEIRGFLSEIDPRTGYLVE